MPYFTIIPIGGLNTSVPQNNPSLFDHIQDDLKITRAVGGENWDITRKKYACSKARGYSQWSAAATDQATQCLGLFELYDGTNRDHLYFDEGRLYVYNSSKVPYEAILNFDAGSGLIAAGDTITDGTTGKTAYVVTVTVTTGTWGVDAAGTLHLHSITGAFGDGNDIEVSGKEAEVDGALTVVTFATDNRDLYSILRVGSYAVWADRAEHEPYKWANGDDYASKLIASGNAYKFRYLESFQRRVIGAHSSEPDVGSTTGNIEVRWSTAWPTTAIASLNFPATNQLYVPNDDPISGLKRMGMNRCFVYSDNSIHSLDYYGDAETPFRIRNVIEGQGCAAPHSIINLGDRHYLFNKNYGFCEFRGTSFPYGGKPISEDIEGTIAGINAGFVDLIVGKFIPWTRECVWAAPLDGGTPPSHLIFFNIDSKTWRIEDKAMRCIDLWRMTTSQPTWNNLITDLGGTGATWSGSFRWTDFMNETDHLVYSNTDGHLYYQTGENLAGSALAGYRIEPILNLSGTFNQDLLSEIWFDIGLSGNYSIDVHHRGGDTVGEVVAEPWVSVGSVSCNSIDRPVLSFNKSARLHQIKWGTDAANEPFEVSGIRLKYEPGSDA